VGPAPPASRPFDESLLRGREFLLEAAGSPPPEGKDAVLGGLTHDPALLKSVQALLQGAAAGELDAATLVPRWAEYLQAWARRTKTEPWVSGVVRVGEPLRSESREVMVPVRVSTAEIQAVGWVVLVPEGKGYLISDVQLVPQERTAAPIDPESADQPTSSPIRR
jgi:hypothetical protein